MMQQKRKTTRKKRTISIKNKNVVNVHFHRSKKTRHDKTETRRSVFDQFQPRLPINHPFVNAPVQQTPLQNPVNVFVNPLTGGTLTNNTPAPSALAAHVGAAPAPHTPAPHTPTSPKLSLNIPTSPKLLPHTPTSLELSPKDLFSPGFSRMNVRSLRKYASENKINLHGKKHKNDLKRIIKEYEEERKKNQDKN